MESHCTIRPIMGMMVMGFRRLLPPGMAGISHRIPRLTLATTAPAMAATASSPDWRWNAPVAIFSPLDASHAGIHGKTDAHQSNIVQIDQHAVQVAGIGGQRWKRQRGRLAETFPLSTPCTPVQPRPGWLPVRSTAEPRRGR